MAVREEDGKSTARNQAEQALQDITFGSIAGIVGKYIEYPFDTVKVRLQSQPTAEALRANPGMYIGQPIYVGPLDCFKQSIRRDGFLSLYRGISAPLLGAAIETSCLFFSYRLAQALLQATIYQKEKESGEALPMRVLILCGAASGAFTSLFLTPIELVKCRMQVPAHDTRGALRSPGPLTLVARVFREGGLLGFWHGQLGTLIRETGGSAAWFGSYEGVSLAFRNMRARRASHDVDSSTPLPIYQQLLAGAVAGMSYNFVFYPADTIKSRMQTEDIGGLVGARRATFAQVGRALWRDQGLRGLYRGCGITVARAAPSSAFIFTVYEGLKNAFGS